MFDTVESTAAEDTDIGDVGVDSSNGPIVDVATDKGRATNDPDAWGTGDGTGGTAGVVEATGDDDWP